MKKYVGIVCGALIFFAANLAGALEVDRSDARHRRHPKKQKPPIILPTGRQETPGTCPTGDDPIRQPVGVPEPSLMLLLGSGLIGLEVLRRRKQ